VRIALVHNLPSGGAKRHTREQLRELSTRGHQIVEFAPESADSDFTPFTPYLSGRRVYPFTPVDSPRRVPLVTPYLNVWAGLRTLARMDSLSRQMAHDIDAAGFDLAFAKDCQLIMNPYVLRHVRTPSLFQCHHGLRHRVENAQRRTTGSRVQSLKNVYYSPARGLFDAAFRHAEARNIRSAGQVLTNSRFSQALIARHYRRSSRVIYPGIDTQLFQPQPVSTEPYVLSVGALIYSKGHRFVLTALGRLPDASRPPLRIVANSVAAEEQQVICRMANELGVQVDIETVRDDQRLVEIYSRARVFVYAPEQEALGMAPLEALACGTPVVAVGEGGVLETIADGTTGLLVKRDPDAFAAALSSVLTNDSLRRRLADAGVDYVRTHWTWRRAVDELEQSFRYVSRG
jgi:glycosyltransferase involved in cell wall biosynthesis